MLSVINSTLSRARAAAGGLAGACTVMHGRLDDMHRTGWAVRAWTMAWLGPGWLCALAPHDEAALLLGGCAGTGPAPVGAWPLPPELEALLTGQGDPHLLDLFVLGQQ